jgi:hypothetical protein
VQGELANRRHEVALVGDRSREAASRVARCHLEIRFCYSCYFFLALSMSMERLDGIADTNATAETRQETTENAGITDEVAETKRVVKNGAV